MRICNLTCDYMSNPIGFDFRRPGFGWMTESSAVNGAQSAYRLQVAGDDGFAGIVHDTGRVESGLSAGVQLDLPLKPRTRYFWRVRIWNGEGRESDWSEAAWFETAKYDEPWSARWIGWSREFPQLRKSFALDKPVRSARAYACGVGLYVMYMNGGRVSDEYLAPGFTAYDSWLQYQTYDVTDLLRQGENVVGCQLGNGYYKGRVNWPEIRERDGDRWNIFGDKLAFICELHVRYEDGTEEIIVTDDSWKAAESPWLRAEIYDGEVFDARKVVDGWCTAECDASGWDNAGYVDIDTALLQARRSVPVKLHERLKPVTVPNYLRKTGIWQFPTTGWGDAATVIPWTMYVSYGDKAVLEAQYPSMKAWVDYMTKCDTLGVDRYYGLHLGDWLAQDTKDPDNLRGLTPVDLIATAFYALSASIVARAAGVLDKPEDRACYENLSERVRAAFRREYVSLNGRVVSETQTAQAIALFFDMLLPEQKGVAAEHLAERLRIDHVQLTTGFLGTPYLCPALSENGLNEYAYALLLQNQCPSWLYEVEMGATTLWERWNSVRPDGSFGPVGMNSLNHYAFGAICEWLYRWVAGINPVESAPGFKRSLLRPMPNSLLQHANASLETPYGLLRSGWRLTEDGIELEFEIPFNATAEIVLPDSEGTEVLENGKKLPEGPIVRGSGVWRYVYRPNGNTIDRRVDVTNQF